MLERDGLPGLRDLIRREVQARGATMLVLDGFVAAAESGESTRVFKRFLNELQTQATMTGCTILLLTAGSLDPQPPEHTMVDGFIELASRLTGGALSVTCRCARCAAADTCAGCIDSTSPAAASPSIRAPRPGSGLRRLSATWTVRRCRPGSPRWTP